jgi:hypothetical protein
MDALRHAIRVRHYSIRTEEAYVDWARRFIRIHGRRHPRELGASEVAAFLTHLAVDRTVAPSTQNQARSALMFLYREVLQLELPWLQEVVAEAGGVEGAVALIEQDGSPPADTPTGIHQHGL